MRRELVWSLVLFVLVAVAALGATIGVGHSPLLGLDLKGGVSVVLEPQGTANSSELNQAVSIIERRVNGLGVSNSEVARQGKDVVIDLPGIKNSQQALAQLGETAQLFFRPVYCQIPAALAVAPSTTRPSSPSTTSAKTSTTAARSPSAATGESTTTAGPTRSSTAPASTRSSVAGAGSAVLASVDLGRATGAPATTTPTSAPATTAPTTTAPAAASTPVSQSDCSSSDAATLATTSPSKDISGNSVILPVDPKAFGSGSSDFRYILGPADMSGTAISDASAVIDPTTGQYSVNLTLNGKGASAFDKLAQARYQCHQQDANSPCSQEAFELDGLVESAPTFNTDTFNGQVSITGSFTGSQARALADALKYGSLPVRFVPQSVQTVSATIGKDSLRAGLLAGLGGLVVVLVYMILYYRALGLVVLAGLAVGGAILYSVITELSHTSNLTLTLAGVTGIIVSIGITVDSYVVYFERLKDEVRAGRSVRQSVERSFSRAFRTVLTADLVSFMAALILYILTVGDVRGFAFTLGLSTLLDVVTAYFFIRPAVILVGRRRSITENRFFGIARGLGAGRGED